MKLKVLLVSPSAPPIGGITRWTESLIEACASDPEVEIIHVNSHVGITPSTSGHARCKRFKSLVQLPILLAKIRRNLRSEEPPVIHIASSGSYGHLRDIAVTLVARVFHKPVILHLHHGRWNPQSYRPEFADTIGLRVLRPLVQQLVVLDSRTASLLERKWPSLQVTNVSNFIPSDYANSDESPKETYSHLQPFVAYLGRLAPGKGLDDLLDAWLLLPSSEWNLVLCGPPESHYGRRLIARVEVIPNCTALEPLDFGQTKDFLLASEFLVLPSESEGSPMATLEAMALGKPIIATPVGDVSDYIGECGLLVQIGNVPDLVEKLTKLMLNPSLRTALGDSARRLVGSVHSEMCWLGKMKAVWFSAAGATRGTIPS